MTDNNQQPSFDTFAVVEIFGHQKLAGRVSEQVIAGQGFIRIDVPAVPSFVEYGRQYPEIPAYTRLFGPSAIYSITPCSEEVANAATIRIRERPVEAYVPVLPSRVENSDDDDDTDF